ncbi:ribosome biogenesis factor YjgA [Thiohalophilus sp.]|uniref:ribosome biogenesis factor YjgA n=1 Tax=Thiohalophilus sp. TaxID=3028392 RepID=UPI00397552CC
MTYDDHDEEWISKSRRKRECHALQDLGSELVKLSRADLDKIPLDDELQQAINEARRIKQRGALKRQMQFIGKLMRQRDAEALQQAYDRVMHPFEEDIKHFHQLEKWRERLLTDGDAALEKLVEEQPDTDRQHVRQLIRSARNEQKQNKPPKAARELFQYLKSLMGS